MPNNLFARSLFCLLMVLAIAPASAASPSNIAQSFGVNVHMDAQSLHYGNIAGTYDRALWIGATHLREQAPNPGDTYTLNAMLTGCTRGLSWTLIIMGDPATYWPNIDRLAQHPGCLHALEGPNEVNLTPPVYGGLKGYPAAIAIQKALYARAKADPLTSSLPVYSPTLSPGGSSTGLGNLGAYADYAASHDYMTQGYPPACCIMIEASFGTAFAPTRPPVMTETGYRTMTQTSNAVDEPSQARLMFYTLFDALAANVADVTMYQLLDAQSDTTGKNFEAHWGFFNGNAGEAPKVSAYAFRYTMSLIGQSTMLKTPVASYTGLPYYTRSLTTRGLDGTIYVVLWPEAISWDDVTHSENQVPATTAHMTLDKKYSSVKLYDPILTDGQGYPSGSTSLSAAHTYQNISSLSLPIKVDPLIIALKP